MRMAERLAKGDQLQPTNAKLMLDDGRWGVGVMMMMMMMMVMVMISMMNFVDNHFDFGAYA